MSDNSTPSEKLTEVVIAKLVGSRLLREERRTAVAEKIAAGQMRSEDWRTELDLASAKASEQ